MEVSISQCGRIVVKSASVAIGYDCPRGDDQLGDGIYQTRDLGFLDPAGRLHLTGILGGAINVAGRKISPAKVEAALLSTGLVRSVKVFGTPSSDAERHEEICASVELMPGTALDVLKQAATVVLQNWEMPRHWRTM